jgi:uncharacterized membrane protein YuzA (DUF378 family)
MSSTTNYLEKQMRSSLGKHGSDIASIVFIVVGVAAIVFFLSPR